MPKLEYFIVCEAVSVDQETNRVSIFNVLEDYNIPASEAGFAEHPEAALDNGSAETPERKKDGSPAILPGFVAVACFNKEDGEGETEHTCSLRVYFKGESKFEHSLPFRLEQLRQRLIMRFVGFPQPEPGQFRFELLLDGAHAAEHLVNMIPR